MSSLLFNFFCKKILYNAEWLEKVSGMKRCGHNACRQEVGRCCSSGEYEETVVCDEVKDSHWL